MRPGCSSGNYSRHIDPILGFERGNRALYHMDILGHSKQSLSRASLNLPTLPPHESFSDDITEDAAYSVKLAEMLSAGMPPAYTEHPIVRSARDDELVAPLALYADAVPYSQTDSVLGFWLVNLVTQRRYHAGARAGAPSTRSSSGWRGRSARSRLDAIRYIGTMARRGDLQASSGGATLAMPFALKKV